jgi:hypothetical protein
MTELSINFKIETENMERIQTSDYNDETSECLCDIRKRNKRMYVQNTRELLGYE